MIDVLDLIARHADLFARRRPHVKVPFTDSDDLSVDDPAVPLASDDRRVCAAPGQDASDHRDADRGASHRRRAQSTARLRSQHPPHLPERQCNAHEEPDEIRGSDPRDASAARRVAGRVANAQVAALVVSADAARNHLRAAVLYRAAISDAASVSVALRTTTSSAGAAAPCSCRSCRPCHRPCRPCHRPCRPATDRAAHCPARTSGGTAHAAGAGDPAAGPTAPAVPRPAGRPVPPRPPAPAPPPVPCAPAAAPRTPAEPPPIPAAPPAPERPPLAPPAPEPPPAHRRTAGCARSILPRLPASRAWPLRRRAPAPSCAPVSDGNAGRMRNHHYPHDRAQFLCLDVAAILCPAATSHAPSITFASTVMVPDQPAGR